MIKVALIGIGGMGNVHFRSYKKMKNAKVIADGGGAVLVEENGDMCRTVCESIEKIYSDRELCDRMGKNIHKFARLDAGKRIYEEIVKLINKK